MVSISQIYFVMGFLTASLYACVTFGDHCFEMPLDRYCRCMDVIVCGWGHDQLLARVVLLVLLVLPYEQLQLWPYLKRARGCTSKESSRLWCLGEIGEEKCLRQGTPKPSFLCRSDD